MASESQICPNCNKPVSVFNFTTHVLHCQRNFSLCKLCKEVVPINDTENHLQTAHKIVKCPLCKEEFENYKVEDHQAFCTKRLVQCIYCELEVPCDTLNEHEDYCGSRTEKCVDCNQYVRLRDNETHKAAGHPPNERITNNNFSPLRNDFSTQQAPSIPPYPKKINLRNDSHRHQSPIKRTNDKPQVNTNFPEDWKESQKISINDVETDSGTSRYNDLDDIDHLIAYQFDDLAQQSDAGFPNLVDAFKRSDRLAFNDVWSQTAERRGLQTPDLLCHTKSPIREINAAGSDTFVTEDALPCEFCGELYPADLLIQHETGCCPDVAHGIKQAIIGADMNDGQLDSNLIEPTNKMQPEEVVMLPCDHCKMLFPEELLLVHEDMCYQNPVFDDSEPVEKILHYERSVAMLPCGHCYQQFPEDIFLQHEELCSKNQELSPDPADVFLANLMNPNYTPKPPPRRTSVEATHKKKHESKPPSDKKFSDLIPRPTIDKKKIGDSVTSPNRTKSQTHHALAPVSRISRTHIPSRNQNDVMPFHARRSTEHVSMADSLDIPFRFSDLSKSRGESHKNVNVKTKQSSTNTYLQEMRDSLRPSKYQQPKLIATGTRPKLTDVAKVGNDSRISKDNERVLVSLRQQLQHTADPSSSDYVPSYCKSDNGRLEDTYQRFLAQRRAQYDSQRRSGVLPKIGHTGAVPKSKKPSSEE